MSTGKPVVYYELRRELGFKRMPLEANVEPELEGKAMPAVIYEVRTQFLTRESLCALRFHASLGKLVLTKGDPERSPLNLQRPYRTFLPLLLPLYYPLAMRIATDHILGKSESKIGV